MTAVVISLAGLFRLMPGSAELANVLEAQKECTIEAEEQCRPHLRGLPAASARKIVLAALTSAMIGLLSPTQLCAQIEPVTPGTHVETAQELAGRITPSQRTQLVAATTAFNSHQYAGALVSFKSLLRDLPAEPLLAKFASDSALQLGDADFAVAELKPVVAANPEDWQALAMLTRAYAQSGDRINRDAGIAQMLVLHKRGVTPPGLKDYKVEWIKAGDNALLIWTSLEPWGYYKTYDLGEVFDSKGALFLSISIESSDLEQKQFAREHPKEASEGVREFSLDAYRETGLNAAGQRTQTHYTFGFFTGQPTYDTVREEFVKIANGKATPLSSRTNLVVP
jgi:tetratricopeptide (TPR) repeat protein